MKKEPFLSAELAYSFFPFRRCKEEGNERDTALLDKLNEPC